MKIRLRLRNTPKMGEHLLSQLSAARFPQLLWDFKQLAFSFSNLYAVPIEVWQIKLRF